MKNEKSILLAAVSVSCMVIANEIKPDATVRDLVAYASYLLGLYTMLETIRGLKKGE